jgi:hypothetical protein
MERGRLLSFFVKEKSMECRSGQKLIIPEEGLSVSKKKKLSVTIRKKKELHLVVPAFLGVLQRGF